MRNVSRNVTGVFIIGLLVGVLATVALASDKDTLITGVAAPPETMDPQGSKADSNYSVMTNIFDALLQRDDTGKLMPALATSWEKIDTTTWRFHLRQGVKFHNGNDFTWKDVKFTFARANDPEVSKLSWMGPMTKSVEPVDGDLWTIDIKVNEPISYYIQNIPQVWIMDKESTENRSVSDIGLNPIGTGAYRLVEWVRGSHVKLVANEDYWGGVPPITNIIQRTLTEDSTRLAALLSGEVDLVQNVPVEQYDSLLQNPHVALIQRADRRVMYLGLQNRPGSPTSDIRVRQAVAMAIDVDELIDKVLYGHAVAALAIVDPATVGYYPEHRLPFDPVQAKRLLTEAGYPDGFHMTLTAPNDRYPNTVEVCQAIAMYLAKIGIDVELDLKPQTLFWPATEEHNLDAFVVGAMDGAYSFSRAQSSHFHTVEVEENYGATNPNSMSYPLVDMLIEEAQSVTDQDLFVAMIELAQRFFVNQVAVIPLYFGEQVYAAATAKNMTFHPRPDTWLVYKLIVID